MAGNADAQATIVTRTAVTVAASRERLAAERSAMTLMGKAPGFDLIRGIRRSASLLTNE
jgi:hypothetical protein